MERKKKTAPPQPGEEEAEERMRSKKERKNGKRCENGQMNFMFYGLLISVSISYFCY